MNSLRARKKAATRQRIADLATVLFLQRGFDNVTISEIAEAAEVSKVTIFNYFPRKEDIFFDRAPQAEQLLTTAIRDRTPDQSPLRALRRLLLDLAEQHHPLGGFRENYAHFWRTVQDSPALRSRAREALEELEAHLAALLAEHSDDPHPRLTAALALAAYRSVYVTSLARILTGDNAADVTRDHIAAVDRAFDVLENGLR
ncbi:TetR/AcrR family transcriptional regulator [Actinopolymorpha pittospori]